MTVRIPGFIQGASHPAEDIRQALLGGELSSAGVVGTGDFAVSAFGTPNMTVNVAAGYAVIAGTSSANQGLYRVFNDATVNIAIAAADPTNPRIDLIVLTINDAFYSGATNNAVIQRVAGTPAASPSAPATPASSIVLAQIAVAANVVSITNANITDKRSRVIDKPITVQADAAAAVAAVLKQASGQTAHLLDCQDVNGNVLPGGLDANGNIRRPFYRGANAAGSTLTAATWTAATCAAVTSSGITLSGSRYTFTYPGTYRISVGAAIAPASGLSAINLRKNSAGSISGGTPISAGAGPSMGAGNPSTAPTCNGMIDVVANDYVEFFVWSQSGGILNSDNTGLHIEIDFVSS